MQITRRFVRRFIRQMEAIFWCPFIAFLSSGHLGQADPMIVTLQPNAARCNK